MQHTCEQKILFALFILWMEAGFCHGHQRSLVQLPESYTAMKGDIVVSFSMDFNSSNFKSFNAMIHLEYLPGDSVFTNSHSVSSSVHLAR